MMMHPFPRVLAPCVVVLLLTVAACGGEEPGEAPATMDEQAGMTDTEQRYLVDVLADDARFDTLVSALRTTGLMETLESDGPFTVFAPTNEAFAALPEGTLQALDQDELINILSYHILNGRLTTSDIGGMTALPTAQGSDLSVTVTEGGAVMINDANVLEANIEADNGFLHAIDQVLMPPSDEEM